MTKMVMSRRHLLGAGACALTGAVSLPAAASASAAMGLDAMRADNFTFSSAAGDDHLSKSVFKTRCWETQINYIDGFELERVAGNGNDAFVKYLCRTKNGKSFRNVEYLRVTDEKVEAIECYFGEKSSFPSAVSGG
jgi:hypothetical protein